MNKYLSIALISLAATSLAHGEDYYLGATVGLPTGGHISRNQNGVATERGADRKAVPLGVFGGYVLSPDWALEAGYRGAAGTTNFDLAPGYQLRARASAAYVAARGDWRLDDDWALFAKAGVARGRATFSVSGKGAPAGESVGKTGAYVSVGASYLIAKDLALQLELEHTNKLKHEGLTANMDRFSLGLRAGF